MYKGKMIATKNGNIPTISSVYCTKTDQWQINDYTEDQKSLHKKNHKSSDLVLKLGSWNFADSNKFKNKE